LILYIRDYGLPGVFADNPYPSVVNGSLWSLFYEVVCYAMILLLGVAPLLRSERRFLAFIALYAGFYGAVLYLDALYDIRAHHTLLRNFHQLSLPFVFGMAAFHFRRRLAFSGLLLAVGLAGSIAASGTAAFEPVFVLSWSYGIFAIGFRRIPGLLAYNALGDYSYGMYIYAFPVEQIVSALSVTRTPLVIIGYGFPATLLLAVLSWHLVERHALRQRSAAAAWLSARLRPLG
jgi:peptidoglycan/LPS O-acetylase OafA/YrhL